MTRRTSLVVRTLSIPPELWSRPDPEASHIPVPTPHISVVTWCLPLVAAVAGYSAAMASTVRLHVLAGLLLLVAFVVLAAFGCNVARFALDWVQRRQELAYRSRRPRGLP
jgi:hypothetical protein